MPWIAFGLGLNVLRKNALLLTHLDTLGFVLFFLLGALLVWSRKGKRSFVSVLFWPFGLGLAVAFIALLTDLWFGSHIALNDWITREAKSVILPHFFQREAWQLGGASGQVALDLYDSVVSKMLKEGILGWFAAMVGFAFFMNATIETMIRGFRISHAQKRLRLWAEFNAWRASDRVLWILLLGLLILAIEIGLGPHRSQSLRMLGWAFALSALFPIFCQGVCFASFMIPRVSFLPFVLIFALLILNPVPFLLVAGLADLWFDFRSRWTARIN